MGDVPGSRAEGRPRLPVARGPQPAASAAPTLNPQPWAGLGPALCDHPLPWGLSRPRWSQEGIPWSQKEQ